MGIINRLKNCQPCAQRKAKVNKVLKAIKTAINETIKNDSSGDQPPQDDSVRPTQ